MAEELESVKFNGTNSMAIECQDSIFVPLRPRQKRTLDHSQTLQSLQPPGEISNDSPSPAKKAKQGPLPDHDEGGVEEVPRSNSEIGAITAQPHVEVLYTLVNAQTKRMKIVSASGAWDINLLFQPNGQVKISSPSYPTELQFRFDAHGELNLSVSSSSTVTLHLKAELLETNGDGRIVLRTRPHGYRSTVFLFLKLYAELRIQIYDLVLEADGTSGWLSSYRERHQRWLANCRGSPLHLLHWNEPTIKIKGHKWCLGSAQKLLWINQQIRAEVSAKVFQVETISFFREEFSDLDILRKVLWQIGDVGKKSVKELSWVRWWTSSWDGDKSKKNLEIEVVSDVVRRLQECTNLQRLTIQIPGRKGLAPSKLRSSQFKSICGFGLLRTIQHVPNVEFLSSPNIRLTKWLYNGMVQTELAGPLHNGAFERPRWNSGIGIIHIWTSEHGGIPEADAPPLQRKHIQMADGSTAINIHSLAPGPQNRALSLDEGHGTSRFREKSNVDDKRAAKKVRLSRYRSDEDDVEEIPRTAEEISAIGTQPDGEIAEVPLSAHTQHMKLVSGDRTQDVSVSLDPNGNLKIILAGHPMELAIRTKPNGEMRVSMSSNSNIKPYVKHKNLQNRGEKEVILCGRPNQYRRFTFLFHELPQEVRDMIYKKLVYNDKKGWASSCLRRPGEPAFTGVCHPQSPQALGVGQKLLCINRKIRAEVAKEYFRISKFDFSEADHCYHNLTIVRDVLEQMGEVRRADITQLQGIMWWTPAWDDDVGAKLKPGLGSGPGLAGEVVRLLKSCHKLEKLEIQIPENKGLVKSRLKEKHFGTVCAFDLLYSVKHVRHVNVRSPYEALSDWLQKGMRKIEQQHTLGHLVHHKKHMQYYEEVLAAGGTLHRSEQKHYADLQAHFQAPHRKANEADTEEVPNAIHETEIAIAQRQSDRIGFTIFPFFKLPAELRLEIYNLVLDSDNLRGGSMRGRFPVQNKPGLVCRSMGRRALGVAQKLVWINKKIRTEVAAEIFRIETFDFDSSRFWNLEMVRDILIQIGEVGRDSIKELRAIRWWPWGEDWKTENSPNSEQYRECAAAVVDLIKSCKNLERLSIRLPFHEAITPTVLRPSEFGDLCGLGFILSVTHVRHVSSTSAYADLGKLATYWYTLHGLKDNMQWGETEEDVLRWQALVPDSSSLKHFHGQHNTAYYNEKLRNGSKLSLAEVVLWAEIQKAEAALIKAVFCIELKLRETR
ncbi:uncharacterized protein BDZ99DRAFT_527281 [Mytilinidion resinicola]|uniref:F-box domain-containing protein n=1 Tax=Mytilinidion resinicola TaxID=574789 RepID=A0A6A6Y2W1_9PEZI|nr:uncharacterized protein BDZ99DRAFT_527281 [Mytilinidion resinicola]KAF2802555.1 hypothetical protein BDZ99DRAFT_527281 [Mytilinidion resinicola]